MFNRDLTIVQTGCTITRVIPRVCSGHCKLSDILLTVSWRASNHNIFIIAYTFFTSCLLRRKFMILYFHIFCTSHILFTLNTLHFVKLINHRAIRRYATFFLLFCFVLLSVTAQKFPIYEWENFYLINIASAFHSYCTKYCLFALISITNFQ